MQDIKIKMDINRCENLDDWTFVGCSYAKDTAVKYEGTASIRVAGYGANDNFYHTFSPSLELSESSSFYFYWKKSGYVTNYMTVRLWEDASNYSDWADVFVYYDNWTKITLNLSNPTSEVGNLSFKNINRIYFIAQVGAGEGEQWIDYIHVEGEISDSDIKEPLIEAQVGEIPTLDLTIRNIDESYIFPRDHVVEVFDSLDKTIFQGRVEKLDYNQIQKIECIGLSDELNHIFPKGDYQDYVGNVITGFINSYCDYCTVGDIASGSIVSGSADGSKTLFNFIHWGSAQSFRQPWFGATGDINIDAGGTSLGISGNQTSGMRYVEAIDIFKRKNKIIVFGGYVNGIQLSGLYEDTGLQKLGVVSHTEEWANITDQTTLDNLASGIYQRESTVPIGVTIGEFLTSGLSIEFMQPGKYVELEYKVTGMREIPTGNYIVQSTIYNPKSLVNKISATNGITSKYGTRRENLPEENAQKVDQIAEYAIGGTTPELEGNLDCKDKALTNIKSIAFNDGDKTITEVKDEDNMVSNSATKICTQQSIKAYTDNTANAKVSNTAYSAVWNGIQTIAPSKNTIYDKIELLNKHIIPDILGGYGGFILSQQWYVGHSDNNAFMATEITVPQTRNDWKIRIFSMSSTGTNSSGIISLGAYGNGEDYSGNNIFNGVNFDITHAGNWDMAISNSGTFTAAQDDHITMTWSKDANDGAGSIYILAILLTH